eukprot:SAG25_NODE_10583_length_328_cov_11.681223_1_plen_36_part_10
MTASESQRKRWLAGIPPYPQYVDDGQLALEVALVMR